MIVLSVTLCRHGDIRLVGGYTDYEGRVQVCSNGYWGRVCGYSWNADSAVMVCRQLFGENKCKAHNHAFSVTYHLQPSVATSISTYTNSGCSNSWSHIW